MRAERSHEISPLRDAKRIAPVEMTGKSGNDNSEYNKKTGHPSMTGSLNPTLN